MKKTLKIQDEGHLRVLSGDMDRNLKMIEQLTGVTVGVRGEKVFFDGPAQKVEDVWRLVVDIIANLGKGRSITNDEIENIFRQLINGTTTDYSELAGETVVLTPRKRVVPKSLNQKLYLERIGIDDIVFGVGPAGTGKTYLAMAAAIRALVSKEVSRIILTRPAVEAGEKLGFLPGDMYEKVNPYLRPLYDALFEMLTTEKAMKLVEKGVIEIAPLAFMRGRTLNDSFVILDEAQNTTTEQMKMFLTRLGFDSRAVITGDITQIDLPHHSTSGLVEVMDILDEIEGISFVIFNEKDVVRHPLVQAIIKAYENRGI
ncbi:MAG: PhoH family protein [bacterium]|nr:PhoH family protein [bacterium]MDT8364876.1 PhoH family protein [bacterium]